LDAPPAGPLTVRVRRDDGVIVYINGLEVFRDNMPDGPVDYNTPAVTAVEANGYLEFTVDDPFYFFTGYNVISAEVHQHDLFSSDLVFDLQMSSGPPPRAVAITSPANNTTVGPGTDLTITASASPDNEVVAVDFYEGTNLLAHDQQAPYQAVLPAGTQSNYVLRAVALFSDSTSLTSAPVRVSVATSLSVVRGPYLQMGTPKSIVVKWRTDFASDSVVRYGLSADLDRNARVSTTTTEHEVPLANLSSDTKYFYSIGSSSSMLASGVDYFFVTSPAGPKPTRIWVIGDSGTGFSAAHDVYLSYQDFTGSRYTDLWLMLGDNAYGSGTDAEYQYGMFNMYPELLRQTVVWSTIGNHDFSPAYFDIFTLPRNGEAGGVPSGVENYYSFDYGAIHFVCLGGYYSGSRLSNGVMCTWLKADLEANTNKWLIAFWHQPPYTMGSHNSEREFDLVEMRENAVPILESYGVDLVLCGHSHVYERSYLLHGHYGFTNTFQWSMVLDAGSGRMDETGPYVKQTSGADAEKGTVYVVAGSSGWNAGCCNGVHPVMYKSLAVMGSLVLDVDGDALNATFLRDNGAVDDYFTLVKNDTNLRIVDFSIKNGTATLSWTSIPGKYYRLEVSSNLAGQWTPAGDDILASNEITGASHATAGARQLFYRVVQVD